MGSIITQLFFYILALILFCFIALGYLTISISSTVLLLLFIIIGMAFGASVDKHMLNKSLLQSTNKDVMDIVSNVISTKTPKK